MAYWLMKTEPDTFSWNDLVKDGKAMWDGVRNFAARNHMKAMKAGDQVFIYHSNIGKEIVGVAKVIKEAYPDPTAEDAQWAAIDVAPEYPLKNPVTLKQLKEDERFKDFMLVTHSRLSVMPVTREHFDRILKLSEKA